MKEQLLISKQRAQHPITYKKGYVADIEVDGKQVRNIINEELRLEPHALLKKIG